MLAAAKIDEIAAIVFVDIAVIIVVARLMAGVARKLRQPAVVGEIIAGILLGPTLLGLFPGNLPEHLFPLEVRPFLKVVSQLGLIIFMFIVGLEFDVGLIKGKGRTAATISLSSIALPFGLGLVLAIGLHGSHDMVAGELVDFWPFALFIGASMSVTAFPVLARILTERGMHRTEIGGLVLAAAAVDDIMAWSLLALVVSVVAATGALDLPIILGESLLFVAVMFLLVRPQLHRLAAQYRRAGHLTPNVLAVVLVGFLVSAWITDRIGIHSIFGAFVFGVIMPREDTRELFRDILERLEQVTVLLLLPVFFVVTGLDTNVRGLGSDALTQLPLILLVACAGKFLGASAAARARRMTPRKASAIGILMNTRGLTELVLLNVGRSFGVLDDRLFTMLVVMAVFTTVITEPLLRLVYPDRILERDVAEAERAALGIVDAYRVVVSGRPDHEEALVDIALEVIGDERPAEVVLTRYRPARERLEVGGGLTSELAEMATSLDELHSLTQRVEGRGVASTVRSGFTHDLPRELSTLAQAAEADLVLVTAGTESEARLLDETPCAVAVVDGGRPSQVAARDDGDAPAAVEIALRLARSRAESVDIAVRGSRRTTRWVEQAGRTGIECRLVDGGLAQEVLLVRGAVDDDGRGVDGFLARVAEGRQSQQ